MQKVGEKESFNRWLSGVNKLMDGCKRLGRKSLDRRQSGVDRLMDDDHKEIERRAIDIWNNGWAKE